jgi:hypothetical protein
MNKVERDEAKDEWETKRTKYTDQKHRMHLKDKQDSNEIYREKEYTGCLHPTL